METLYINLVTTYHSIIMESDLVRDFKVSNPHLNNKFNFAKHFFTVMLGLSGVKENITTTDFENVTIIQV